MNDERMHPTGDDPSWSESYYFNFVDPETGLGMFTRMGFRPGNGWADALHVIYLPGKRVAFTYGRREIGQDLSVYDDDLAAGDLRLQCIQPHKRWRLTFSGSAQDIADASVLLTRSKERPAGWYQPAQLDMELEFSCLTQPHFAARGSHGHFEQSGRVTGTITLNGEQWQVAGFGVRDKSWGPRDWGAGSRDSLPVSAAPGDQPKPFINWFSMNFGEYAAMGGSCFRGSDGVMRGAGWLQREGEQLDLSDVVIESEYAPDSLLHERVRLTAATSTGEPIALTGEILNVCPTKIPMPGGATFVNEGLACFDWGGRIGYGVAEHWHSVKLG